MWVGMAVAVSVIVFMPVTRLAVSMVIVMPMVSGFPARSSGSVMVVGVRTVIAALSPMLLV